MPGAAGGAGNRREVGSCIAIGGQAIGPRGDTWPAARATEQGGDAVASVGGAKAAAAGPGAGENDRKIFAHTVVPSAEIVRVERREDANGEASLEPSRTAIGISIKGVWPTARRARPCRTAVPR